MQNHANAIGTPPGSTCTPIMDIGGAAWVKSETTAKDSMDLITTWRHLFSAVLILGSDQGTVEQRLRDAYRGGLSQISRNPGLPAALQGDYEKLMAELADLFANEGPVDVKRASRLAKQVVAIYDRVAKELQ